MSALEGLDQGHPGGHLRELMLKCRSNHFYLKANTLFMETCRASSSNCSRQSLECFSLSLRSFTYENFRVDKSSLDVFSMKNVHQVWFPSTLFHWSQDGFDCWPRICHNFHQILLEKTKWHIHTFYLAGHTNKEICKTHIVWWIARSHDTPWNIPQLALKPSKWIFPDKWCSAQLFQIVNAANAGGKEEH